MIDKDWPQVKARLETWLRPENFDKKWTAVQELERALRGVEMITIKKARNCQARGCFASLSGCRLDKLYTSTSDAGASFVSFISNLSGI